MAGAGAKDGEPEFQVAPMVDVLLTILVFFMMITSAQVLKVDRTIVLPLAQNAVTDNTKRNQVVINIRWNADQKKPEFVVDDHTYKVAADLLPALKAAKATEHKVTQFNNPSVRALIRADQDLPAIYVSQAMNMCGDSGISDISFSTLNR